METPISEMILAERMEAGHECGEDCFCGILEEAEAEGAWEEPTYVYPTEDREWWANLREYGGEA